MEKRINHAIICLTALLSFCCGMASCDGKQETLKELYQSKNFNIRDRSWEKVLVKIVGKDNYKFMCEQDVTYGPYKNLYFENGVYKIGGSTKNKWEDGYDINFNSDSIYFIEIVRGGERITYPQ